MASILIVLLVLATAGLGSWLTMPALHGWYLQIALPTWTPSGQIIGLVWTVLFLLIAISAVLAWRIGLPVQRKLLMTQLVINLILNVGWSYLFFYEHLIFPAFVEMLFLELSIIILIAWLWSIARTSAYLLIPYGLWVAFATFLTYSIWLLNK